MAWSRSASDLGRGTVKSTWALPYLPGLDGIRALAVIGVLLYHGGMRVPGGFLGVDVFFALSGFLITSILLAEYDQRHRIDLLRFWGKRARRLLPALMLLLVAIGGYLWAIAPATRLAQIRGDGLSALFYVSNWRFIVQGQSYFDQFTSPSPLRHTWSLAIEEQFYIIFPIVLIALLAWWGLRTKRLAVVFLAGALLSATLMAALYSPGTDPSRVYYGTDTRMQAVLLGATIAVIAPTVRESVVAQRLLPIGGAIGLVGLVMAFLLISERSTLLYRGGFLLVSCAALLVIMNVYIQRGWVNSLLNWRPFVALGLISYGVYLWHWPIYLWLTPDRVALNGGSLLILRIFVTVVVATLSFYLVEAPVRFSWLSNAAPRKRLQAVGAAAMAAVVALFAGTALSSAASAASTVEYVAGAGYSGPATKVFLLGDSNTQSLVSGFPSDTYRNIDLATSAQLGCGLIVDTHTAEGKRIEPEDYCYDWRDRRMADARSANPDVAVLFAGSWEQYDRLIDGKVLVAGSPEYTDYLAAQFVELLQGLQETGADVVFVNNHCHRTPDFGLGPEPRIVNDDERVADVNAAVNLAISRVDFPVQLIDANGFLCATGYVEEIDGVQMRTDGLHFTPEGAALVWEWLAPQILDGQ